MQKKAAEATHVEQNLPSRRPAPKPMVTPSASEIHRGWIESQLALGVARSGARIIENDYDTEYRFGRCPALVASWHATPDARSDAASGRAPGAVTGCLSPVTGSTIRATKRVGRCTQLHEYDNVLYHTQ